MTDDLEKALAIPGRYGVTMRRPTAAHPDCQCEVSRRPAKPTPADFPIDFSAMPADPDERAAWFVASNAPYRAALDAWSKWRPRHCPQHGRRA